MTITPGTTRYKCKQMRRHCKPWLGNMKYCDYTYMWHDSWITSCLELFRDEFNPITNTSRWQCLELHLYVIWLMNTFLLWVLAFRDDLNPITNASRWQRPNTITAMKDVQEIAKHSHVHLKLRSNYTKHLISKNSPFSNSIPVLKSPRNES